MPRVLLLLALLIAPSLASAQNAVLEMGGNEYEALAFQSFGTQLVNGVPLGPLELVQVVDAEGDGTVLDGCSPFTNADEVAGKIALISRGTCAFVIKAENAAAAGAVAFVVYNDEDGPNGEWLPFFFPTGECAPDTCTAPGILVSHASYEAFLLAVEAGTPATITPLFPREPGSASLSTGLLTLPVYDNGFFGASPFFTIPDTGFFEFESISGGLFVGTVLVSVDGAVSSEPYGGDSEFEFLQDVTALADVPPPYLAGIEARFRDADLGLAVTHRAYARLGDAAMLFALTVENISGGDLSGVYVGLFTDWDVVDLDESGDDSLNDLGGFDAATGTAFVYDETRTQYYGTAIVGEAPRSGYSVNSDGSEAALFEALSTPVELSDAPAERASVVGSGPYDLAAGERVTVQFALGAGTDEAALLRNLATITPLSTSTETTTSAGIYRLASPYPNPFAAAATLEFALPVAEDVTLAVYDLLGREVARLADGLHPTGTHTVTLDAADLPSGVYLVRLTAGDVALAERVTIAR